MVKIKHGKIVVALIILVTCSFLGFSILFFQGALFQPNAPPPEFAKGWSRIYLLDGMNRTYVDWANIHLIATNNLTPWKMDQTTGTTFYCPTGSIFWANITGYYPIASTLYASGDNDPANYRNNTVNIFRRAEPEDVTLTLVSWQNISSGLYDYSGKLPTSDGYYRLELRVSITGPSRGVSIYGANMWIPNYTLPANTWAANSSLNFISLWFAWKGAITDYKLVEPSWLSGEVYNIDLFNCTYAPYVWYDSLFIIEGNFTNLQSVRVYDGLIDNWMNYAEIITC
ncbi:MAG: hypothetical protein ACTSRC_18750 [Candidatus Helarchaeota archaeon]